MKRCSRCILSDQFPDLTFDENGVCSRCHRDEHYLKRDLKALDAELHTIIEWAKSQNKRYDCVVPFSGGKDSSYTLYLCSVVFGMKVIAVNYNNGLRTDTAFANMERVVHKTGVATASYGPPWSIMKKLYAEFFRKTGQFCFPCDMGIWATVHRVAEQYDVPLIVSGFSAQIESRGAQIYSYSNDMFLNISDAVISRREAKDFLEATLGEKIGKRLKHGRLTRYRRQISLPDYMEWDDKELKRVIHDELGWAGRTDGSTDHVDCRFAPIKNFLMIQKWGFGEKTTKYAAMARAGQLTREQAIERAAQEESVVPTAVLEDFKATFGLTEAEIQSAKTKSHLKFFGRK